MFSAQAAGALAGGLDASLSDVGLALVSLLLVRIVYLASRIERVLDQMQASSTEAGAPSPPAKRVADEEQREPLPHVVGVLGASAAVSPCTAARHGCAAPSAAQPHAEQQPAAEARPADGPPPPPKRAFTLGASAPLLAVGLQMPVEPTPATTPALRRSLTLAGRAGEAPLTPRASRGSGLQPAAGLAPGSPACNGHIGAELEGLDVLPLTTAQEAPLLTRMCARPPPRRRIELGAELEGAHDDVCGDIRLLRFLRGYAHSVPHAAAAFRAMLATRRQHGVDGIRQQVLTQPLEAQAMPHGREIYALYPIQLNCGTCAKGHLVSVDPLGAIQLGALMDGPGCAKLFQFMLGASELRQVLLDERSEQSGRLVQSVQIKDLHGLSLSAFRDPRAVSALQQVVATCTQMYPESLATLYIINAPFFFPMVRSAAAAARRPRAAAAERHRRRPALPAAQAWSVVSNFVSERTQKKVRVLGTDYAQTLLHEVGPAVLDTIEQLHRLQANGGGDVRSDSPGMRSRAGSDELERLRLGGAAQSGVAAR